MTTGVDRTMDTHEKLIAGLVGDNVELFHRNALFHTAIETLANLLPAMIAGLAVETERAQRTVDAAVEMMKQVRPDPSAVNLMRGLGQETP